MHSFGHKTYVDICAREFNNIGIDRPIGPIGICSHKAEEDIRE